jgi:Tol biopolymer transport system component
MLAFVGYRADTSGNVESTLYISDVEGSDKKSLLTTGEIVPFYLYWSPDSRNISFLSSLYNANDLLLQVLPSEGGKPAFIDMGQPFYWSWSADSNTILAHTGGSMAEQPEKAAIKLFDLTEEGHAHTTLHYFPAFFQAPAYSPDGSRLLIAAEMFQRHSTLVIAQNDGEPQDLLVDWQGPLTFSWSPDGKQIAYVTGRHSPIGGSIGTLNILNMSDGEDRSGYQIPSNNVLAFFWSPDSTKIALFEPQIITGDGNQEVFVLAVSILNVVEGKVQSLTTIRPTPSFLGQVIPYYDQYQRSHTIWSPDSTYIVVNGVTDDDLPGIYAVSTVGKGATTFLAHGTYPFWSW